MSKSPEFRTSAGQFDGALPIVINSPIMTLTATAAGLQDQGSFLAPCDLEIVRALIKVLSSTTSSLAALDIGERGDPDSYLDAYPLTDLVAGLHELDLTASQFATLNINKGDVVEFSSPQATAAGVIAVSLVCMPRSG